MRLWTTRRTTESWGGCVMPPGALNTTPAMTRPLRPFRYRRPMRRALCWSPTGATPSTPSFRLDVVCRIWLMACKLAPSVLRQLLVDAPSFGPYQQLLVGTETSDDAVVWQLDDSTCVNATTDFFMPMVDNPRDLGASQQPTQFRGGFFVAPLQLTRGTMYKRRGAVVEGLRHPLTTQRTPCQGARNRPAAGNPSRPFDAFMPHGSPADGRISSSGLK